MSASHKVVIFTYIFTLSVGCFCSPVSHESSALRSRVVVCNHTTKICSACGFLARTKKFSWSSSIFACIGICFERLQVVISKQRRCRNWYTAHSNKSIFRRATIIMSILKLRLNKLRRDSWWLIESITLILVAESLLTREFIIF